MARLPLMIGVAVFCLGTFTAQAQAAHPVAPGTRNTTARSAPSASQPATVVATGPPAGGNSNAASGPPAAVAPTVIFRDGLLTVQTTNSSLNSVVTAIRNKTGIEFEGVEGAGEHVALSLGPAPEGEVLSSIFSGSKYDFVAIDRPDAPGIVQKVIVSIKNKSGSPDAPRQPNAGAQDASDDDDTPDEQVNTEPQDTPVQPPPVQQPQQAPQAQQQPKSPEQLLQELQQMQQQKSGTSDPNAAQAPRKVPQ